LPGVLAAPITTAHLPSDNTLPMEYRTANLVICNVHRKVRDCNRQEHSRGRGCQGWCALDTCG
jgi:hypothetical protein